MTRNPFPTTWRPWPFPTKMTGRPWPFPTKMTRRPRKTTQKPGGKFVYFYLSLSSTYFWPISYFDKINNHYIPSKTGGCKGWCLTVLRPVCGSDGKTYPNLCELKGAKKCDSTLTLQHHGECRKGNSSSILKIINIICRNFIIYNFLFF